VTNGERAQAFRALAKRAHGDGLDMVAAQLSLSAHTLDALRDDPFDDPRREEARTTLIADIRQRFEARLHEAIDAETRARKLKATAEEALRIMRHEEEP